MKVLKCPIGFIEVNGRCVKRHEVNKFMTDSFVPSNSFNGGDIVPPVPPKPKPDPPKPQPDPPKPQPDPPIVNTDTNRNLEYVEDALVAAAGGLITYQAVKRGAKFLEGLQTGQEASEEFERESLLARRSEVERLMEEGIDVDEELELTPLLQRQEATDELLDTFRFGQPVEPIGSGVELPVRNVRVSEPAQLDPPPSSLQALREEMAESFYTEPPLKQTQQLIKDNELDRRISKQKPDMEDVDLTPDVELTPEEEEALQREMETDSFLDPEGDLDKLRKEISDDLGIEDVFEPDEFAGSIMSPAETSSEYGLPVEYYKAIDRGDVKAAENILKGLPEPTGLDAGNPAFQTIKTNVDEFDALKQKTNPFLDAKNPEAERIYKPDTSNIGKEYFPDWLDAEGELDVKAVQEGLFKASADGEIDALVGALEGIDIGGAAAMGLFDVFDYAVTGDGYLPVVVAEGAVGTLGLVTAMASAVASGGSAVATGGASLLIGGALYGVGKGASAAVEAFDDKDFDNQIAIKNNKDIGSRALTKEEQHFYAHSLYSQMKQYEHMYKYEWTPSSSKSKAEHERDKMMYNVFKTNFDAVHNAQENGTDVIAIVDPKTGYAHTFIQPYSDDKAAAQLDLYKDKGYWSYLSNEELALIGLDNIVDDRKREEYKVTQAERTTQRKADKFEQEQEKGLTEQLKKQGVDVFELDEKFYQDYVEAKADPTGELLAAFMDDYMPEPYELGRLERRIEADANEGQIQVYSSGMFEGLTRGEAEIAVADPKFMSSHADILAVDEGHGNHQEE